MKSGTRNLSSFVVAAPICLGAISYTPTYAATAYRTVALTGQQAPGAQAGVVFDFLHPAMMNANGQTLFRATLAGTGVDEVNKFGLWSEGSGSLQLVVRSGDAAPGTEPGVVFAGDGGSNGFISATMDVNGQVAFKAKIDGTGVNSINNYGLWLASSGSLDLIARYDDTATGAAGEFWEMYYPKIVGLGKIAFFGRTTVTNEDYGDDYGLWYGTASTLQLIRRSDDPAVDTQAGQVVYVGFTPNLSSLTGGGNAAFYGFLSGANVTQDNDKSIWSLSPSGMRMVARENSPAPGAAPGIYFDDFNAPPWVNTLGQTAFYAYLGGPGVDSTNYRSIWTEAGGQLEMVAREGDAAPGMAPGVTFETVGIHSLNNSGQTFFVATLIDQNQDPVEGWSLWRHESGVSSLMLSSSDPVPGVEPGVQIDGVVNRSLNDFGQAVFHFYIDGPGIDPTNNEGFWAITPNGMMSLIAREGDLFDVDDDPQAEDLRTIRFIVGGGLNNDGQYVMKLTFTDGTSGLFVATLGLPGDLDGDGFVGIGDLNLVLGNWNQAVPPGDALADANGDGFVGIADLNAVLGNWNAGTPPAAPGHNAHIPEPGTAAVSLLCLSAILRQRGRGGR